MARPAFRRQLDVLVGRAIAVHFGSAGTLLMMVAQAPIIGSFIGLAWKGQEAAPQTYFMMAVAALWMGCMNATTSIVVERQIFERERMFDLNIWSYLLSKLAVLGVICGLQTMLMLAAQARLMHLKESPVSLGLFFLALSATAAASASLGLLISSIARTAYGAVVAVPIALIPQAVFSEVLLQGNIEKTLPSVLEKLTLTKWCYKALMDAHQGAHFLDQLGCLAALAAGLGLFLILAAGKLKWDET
ncbi:MAG: ABC transporter permease [Elusimicrobia bacterium]|nr:ABC transporter permease [Elusimicrobiota bacterium]